MISDGLKATNVDWIPTTPSHWNLKKAKFLFFNKSIKNRPDQPLLSVTQGYGVIRRDESEAKVWNPADDVSSYKLVEANDFVISLRSFEGGLELSSVSGLVSPAYTVLGTIQEIHPKYFWRLMKSSQFITELNKNVTGIRQGKNIGWDDFSNIYLPFPPLDEQRLISRYLDKKTQQIDTLIEKIEKKIELLKEQRTSLINHYVTKGLDPNFEMKDSGVEWIGKIPKHWELKKLFHVTDSIGSGTTPKADNAEYYEGGSINWLVTGDLNDGNIFSTSRQITEQALRDHSALKIYPQNSLLIAMYGATIGKLGILRVSSTVNQATCVMLFTKSHDVDFWFYVLLGHRQYITSLGYGGGQPNISQDVIRNLRFPAPPSIIEQRSISETLKTETESIDAVIRLERRRLNLISEYRQSLISSVVTGKVRVTEDMI